MHTQHMEFELELTCFMKPYFHGYNGLHSLLKSKQWNLPILTLTIAGLSLFLSSLCLKSKQSISLEISVSTFSNFIMYIHAALKIE